MSSNTSISGWHCHGHGTVQQCRTPELLGIPVSADGRLAGMSSPYNTHTHSQKPPPRVWIVSAGAGRGLQVFSAGSSAQPTLQGLLQATSFQELEAGFPLWSYGLHPIRTAQLSAPFFCNRAAGISPRQHVPGTGGKRYQWKEDSGTSQTGRPSGVMPRSAISRTQSSALPLEYTKSQRQGDW